MDRELAEHSAYSGSNPIATVGGGGLLIHDQMLSVGQHHRHLSLLCSIRYLDGCEGDGEGGGRPAERMDIRAPRSEARKTEAGTLNSAPGRAQRGNSGWRHGFWLVILVKSSEIASGGVARAV